MDDQDREPNTVKDDEIAKGSDESEEHNRGGANGFNAEADLMKEEEINAENGGGTEPMDDQPPASVAFQSSEGAGIEEDKPDVDGKASTPSTFTAPPVVGSSAMRPVFLGNLTHDCQANDISNIFEGPIVSCAGPGEVGDPNRPMPVDRVDLKRGFAFVFLRDAASEDDKRRAEDFVSLINGMYVH